MSNINFARTITAWDLGETAASVMTDCEKYGMSYGCNEDCPILRLHKCQLRELENKEMYQNVLNELNDN